MQPSQSEQKAAMRCLYLLKEGDMQPSQSEQKAAMRCLYLLKEGDMQQILAYQSWCIYLEN